MSSITKFEKINPTLDHEHLSIIIKMENLYNTLQQHFKTEERMFKEGIKNIPKDHPGGDTDALKQKEWKKHKTEHDAMLSKLREMAKEVIQHIEFTDSDHFHWTKN